MLENTYLKGYYDISPLQTFYLNEKRLPFVYDSTASQIDNATYRMNDLESFIATHKTQLHGTFENINENLNELNITLGSDDQWYSDDEAYDKFKNRMAGVDVDSWYFNYSHTIPTQQYIYINDPTLVKYFAENLPHQSLGQSGNTIQYDTYPYKDREIDAANDYNALYPDERSQNRGKNISKVKYYSPNDMAGVFHDNKEGETNVYMYPDYPWDSSFIPRTVDLTQLDENGNPIRTDDLEGVEVGGEVYNYHLSTPGILVNKDIFMGVGEDGKKGFGESGDSATANFPR